MVTLVPAPLAAEQMDRLGRAVQLNERGQRDEARALLDAIVQEEPDNHRALWNRGLVAMEDGEIDRALKWFGRAIAIDDSHAEYHLWRGYAYAQKLERAVWIRTLVIAPKLRRSLERAVALAPDHLRAREALMRYYEQAPRWLGGGEARAGEQAEAIRRIRKGLAAPP